jgi:hypothetical protein
MQKQKLDIQVKVDYAETDQVVTSITHTWLILLLLPTFKTRSEKVLLLLPSILVPLIFTQGSLTYPNRTLSYCCIGSYKNLMNTVSIKCIIYTKDLHLFQQQENPSI